MIIIIRSEACHKSDNIEFRLWQPLPPFVFDEEGNRFESAALMKRIDNEENDEDEITVEGPIRITISLYKMVFWVI